MDMPNFISQIQTIGFALVLEQKFSSPHWKDETCCLLWNAKHNILLWTYTYRGNISSVTTYYNVKRKPGNTTLFKYTSSGHAARANAEDPDEFIWIGNHRYVNHIDVKEIDQDIRVLRKCGDFMNPWRENDMSNLWLLHYEDTHGDNYKYEKINAERIYLLPDYIQDAIGVFA